MFLDLNYFLEQLHISLYTFWVVKHYLLLLTVMKCQRKVCARKGFHFYLIADLATKPRELARPKALRSEVYKFVACGC